MQRICSWCYGKIQPYEIKKVGRQYITNGLCGSCTENIFTEDDSEALFRFLNNIDSPVLLIQQQTRLVRSANQKACDLFSKQISEIAGKRGGEVFDCINSFGEKGCGMEEPCENCKIRNTVIDTFLRGISYEYVFTFLEIKKRHAVTTYKLQVSTEKVGDHALLRIDQYEEK